MKTLFLFGLMIGLASVLHAQDRSSGSTDGAATASATSAQWLPQYDWVSQLKKHLPDWFSFGGQYRGRVEGQTGRQFQPGNDDYYYLSQFRFDLKFRLSSHFRVFVEGQDSHAPNLDLRPHPSNFQNSFDLRQGYLEAYFGGPKVLGLQLGRQEMLFGEERVIGAGNWGNSSRSFDAARLYVSTPSTRVDILAASLVRIRDGAFDSGQFKGNSLFGAYSSLRNLFRGSSIEPFFFLRTLRPVRSETAVSGSADIYTFGLRAVGSLPRSFDYGLEIARQGGRYSSDAVHAWAGHWIVGYTFKDCKWQPRLLMEYNYASGDASPRDGRHETFDQLFPTNHNKYGTADVIGWRNMQNLRAGVEQTLRPGLKLLCDYHSHWLAQLADALYSDNGAPVTRPGAGFSSRHVGQEVDLVLLYKISKQYTFGVGYGHLWAGQFLKDATLGSNVSYPYTFLTYAF